jgi:hypothetical protein
VNKTELIEHIANTCRYFQGCCDACLESTIGAVKTTLKKGGSVSLVGFGTFAVGKSVLPALVATPAPALRLKSRPPRFQSSVRARH